MSRDVKIAQACYEAYLDGGAAGSFDRAARAAVREAYRIDGVDKLVKSISKLETAWGESWGTNGRDAMHDVFDAASRVREAMKGNS